MYPAVLAATMKMENDWMLPVEGRLLAAVPASRNVEFRVEQMTSSSCDMKSCGAEAGP